MEVTYRLPEELRRLIVQKVAEGMDRDMEEVYWKVREYESEYDSIVANTNLRCNCFNCKLFYRRGIIEAVRMMKPSFVTRVQRRVVNYEQLLRDLGVKEGSWGAYRRNVEVKEGVIRRYNERDLDFVRNGVSVNHGIFSEYYEEEKRRFYRKLLYLKMYCEGRVETEEGV